METEDEHNLLKEDCVVAIEAKEEKRTWIAQDMNGTIRYG